MTLKGLLFHGWVEPMTKRVWRHLIAEQETTAIPLSRAKVCVQCEMVHQADRCPRCLTSASVPVRKVFRNLERALNAASRKNIRMKAVRKMEEKIPPAGNVARIENGKKKIRQAG